MERAHGSERRSARPKRKPLSDLTNAQPLSSDPSLRKPKTKAERRPAVSVKSSSSIGSSGPEKHGEPRIPTSAPRGEEIPTSSARNVVNHDKSKHSTVRTLPTQVERKDKGKAVATSAALSCPPLERTKRIWGTSKMADGVIVQPGTYSEPRRKTRKRQCHTTAADKGIYKHMMPQDFIEKQRAYFAEIDAFELPEEVVSESELE